MTAEAIAGVLAPLNAVLNFSSFLCLVAGYVFIKSDDRVNHRKAMLGAVSASTLFLVFYVIRFALTGTHRFAGVGFAKTAYLSILFSHMVLAVVVVPLVLRLLYLAFNERFDAHRKLARWTYPIWIYVSVTGIMVYLMLYHIYGYLPEA